NTAAGIRRYPGARFWCTGEGAAVRLIASSMFEVVDSGELMVVMESRTALIPSKCRMAKGYFAVYFRLR
ncbi:MAG: hypothetical protein JF594_29920, partial [Rhizobium leguminosarum]|nr:hypothetical protein [Rhizobium leguminosarum]